MGPTRLSNLQCRDFAVGQTKVGCGGVRPETLQDLSGSKRRKGLRDVGSHLLRRESANLSNDPIIAKPFTSLVQTSPTCRLPPLCRRFAGRRSVRETPKRPGNPRVPGSVAHRGVEGTVVGVGDRTHDTLPQ